MLYLDVLGVRRLACGPDADRVLDALDLAIHQARDMARDRASNPWWSTSWFSDNVCLALPLRFADALGEPEFGTFVNVANAVQLHMALAGFFTRGGATFGSLFADTNIVFGAALVEGVEIEKDVSMPCVALSPALERLVERQLTSYGQFPQHAPQNADLVRWGSRVCFDYLTAVGDYVGESLRENESMVIEHRDLVSTRLRESTDPDIVAKYEWLADYHNYFCRRHRLEDLQVADAPGRHEFRTLA